ncbi:MAG: ATP-binding cassette domain-containing protein [Pseudomonadota bacterium]|nr:ATP-binding cassette domain-containing protein [Burkholderiales bacterium]MDQ3196028.1 ATP-binding cassette domain-containing protein [Pseudomonadota bacterium]
MISLSQVFKRYPQGRSSQAYSALSNISFTIQPGEMVFISGHSGAGKSTLLKLIAGIELPSAGSVIVNGQNVGKLKPAAMPFLRRNFGLVFQQHKLLFDRTVFANVVLPLEIAGFERREAARRVRAALDKVGLLGKEKAWPITLSGGEQQRLCIARAVVNRPSFLLADEPTANLDAAYANDIIGMFQSFNRVGVTVVIATHDEAMLTRVAPRTIALKQGELVAEAEHGVMAERHA